LRVALLPTRHGDNPEHRSLEEKPKSPTQVSLEANGGDVQEFSAVYADDARVGHNIEREPSLELEARRTKKDVPAQVHAP